MFQPGRHSKSFAFGADETITISAPERQLSFVASRGAAADALPLIVGIDREVCEIQRR